VIKLKDLLKEDFVGTTHQGYEVYKNPKSIKRMVKDLRAISFPNGDLFVIDDNWNVIHSAFAEWLSKNGYKTPSDMGYKPGMVKGMKKGFIAWQRKGPSDSFYLSESTDFEDTDFFDEAELMPYLKKYTKKVQQKNPKYKFVLKGVYK
jgi:hypothetical protein